MVNKFFVIVGDDWIIKIFWFIFLVLNVIVYDMVNNFVFEIIISVLFKSFLFIMYFWRCSWLLDGNYIVVVNVVNGLVSSVVIIECLRWDS